MTRYDSYAKYSFRKKADRTYAHGTGSGIFRIPFLCIAGRDTRHAAHPRALTPWDMSRAKDIRTEEITALRKSLNDPGSDRLAAMRSILGRPVRSTRALREWHDLLLFLLAFPRSAKERCLAEDELERLLERTERMVNSSERSEHALINSGIAGTSLQSSFSLGIVRWMIQHWPEDVHIFSVTQDVGLFRDVLRQAVHRSECEALDQVFSDGAEMARSIIGPDQSASRFVSLLDRIAVPERVRSMLFDQLQVYVNVHGRARGPNTSTTRGQAHPVYFHKSGLMRNVQMGAIVRQAVPEAIHQDPSQQEALIHSARSVLCSLQRETDPITYAGQVELFDMGRGYRIALFTLRPGHRLPFESYVGFMAFKNGSPLAYGGAWIFPGRSKVGINVFPAYRGGESAWFFAQLLRLYSQRYEVERFEVENYQLGHDNPDGLRSGAYWFYYRCGFRPADEPTARMAEKEFQAMKERKGYKVPMRIMRRLVAEGMEYVVGVSSAPVIDTMQLTLAIQHHIVHSHGADRNKAIRRALRRLAVSIPIKDLARWKKEERSALEDWALLVDAAGGTKSWSPASRKAFIPLVKAKAAGTETEHALLLRAHTDLLEAAHRLVNAYQENVS